MHTQRHTDTHVGESRRSLWMINRENGKRAYAQGTRLYSVREGGGKRGPKGKKGRKLYRRVRTAREGSKRGRLCRSVCFPLSSEFWKVLLVIELSVIFVEMERAHTRTQDLYRVRS